MARHYAIIKENGEAVHHSFKEWVRQNMQDWQPHFLRTGTTMQFKARLLNQHWVESVGDNTVFVIQPDENGSVEYARNYINDLDADVDENETDEGVDTEMAFTLEADLQRALRQNIQFLEQGLQIIDGGRERHTDAGFIDITARDAQGKVVIIELKAPTAKPDVIAQTLAYMESVKAEDNVEVRGVIVASDFSDRVRLAARQIPHLKLIRYAFQFNFNEVE